MPDEFALSDEEKQAVLAYRRESAPKRKGTLRGTDPDSGAEYEIELTAEETARLAARHLTGLFKGDDGKKDDGKKDDGKPSDIRTFFQGRKQAAGS